MFVPKYLLNSATWRHCLCVVGGRGREGRGGEACECVFSRAGFRIVSSCNRPTLSQYPSLPRANQPPHSQVGMSKTRSRGAASEAACLAGSEESGHSGQLGGGGGGEGSGAASGGGMNEYL